MSKFRLTLLFSAAAVLLAMSACNNVYVQELLRGPAKLESLGVMASDGRVYSSQPDFKPDVLKYSVRVPYAVQDVRILAGTKGKVAFTMNGVTNTSGNFLFLDEERAQATLNVEQDYMDKRIYTLDIVRGSDATLWDIQFETHINVGGNLESIPLQTMSPGYNSDRFGRTDIGDDYYLYAQARTDSMTIQAVLRPNASAEFYCDINNAYETSYSVNLDNKLGPYQPNSDRSAIKDLEHFDPSEDPDPLVFKKTYPVTIANNPLVFYIKVWMNADPSTTAELYKINVKWPNEVALNTTGWTPPGGATVSVYSPGEVVINGTSVGGKYYYNAGDPVSFTLTPPFGTKTQEVLWSKDSGVNWTSLEPNSIDIYSFVMPADNAVRLRASWIQVEPPMGRNVRFAHPDGYGPGGTGGAPGTAGYASKWYTAGDLNTLIANYTGTAPNDYEIWLAQGSYNPPGAAGDFNRSFILKHGIKIYGGFRGRENSADPYSSALSPATIGREYTDAGKTKPKYISELSGNYPNGEKIYHTAIASGGTAVGACNTAYLDGLVIQGSSNSYWGSTGLTINGNSITVNRGGVLYVVNSSPVLKNVTLQGGLAPYAAGLYVVSTVASSYISRPVLLHCRLTNNQSSGLGSTIGVGSGAGSSHLLMIGGIMDVNLDWGGVLNIGNNQKATLVNVSIVNNKENAVHSENSSTAIGSGTGDFVNCTITGNRGADLPNVVSVGAYYNSIIQNNAPQRIPAGLTIANTYAPEHANSLPSANAAGDTTYYPLDTAGNLNNSSPIYNTLTGPGTNQFGNHPFANLAGMLIDALKLDGNGNPRFSGAAIRLGAAQ